MSIKDSLQKSRPFLQCHFDYLSFPQIFIHSEFCIMARCHRLSWVFFSLLLVRPHQLWKVFTHLCLEPRNGDIAALTEAQTMFDRHHEKLWESQSGWKKITGIIISIFLICVYMKATLSFNRLQHCRKGASAPIQTRQTTDYLICLLVWKSEPKYVAHESWVIKAGDITWGQNVLSRHWLSAAVSELG